MAETNKKWTPGIWFAVNQGTPKEPMMTVMAARIAGQKPRHEVAICATGDSHQEMENANAHLIAAAPALYEALEELMRAEAVLDDDNAVLIAARQKAAAALAHARGASQ